MLADPTDERLRLRDRLTAELAEMRNQLRDAAALLRAAEQTARETGRDKLARELAPAAARVEWLARQAEAGA